MAANRPGNSARGGAAAKVTPSPELAAIVGDGPFSRAEIVSRLWDYIKVNQLQDPNDKRQIIADARLSRVFGADRASMFEMNRHLSGHLR